MSHRSPATAPRTGSRLSHVMRRLIAVLGELVLTAGVLMMLYVVWELWWTNIEATHEQRAAVDAWMQDFDGPVPASPQEGAVDTPPTVDPGAVPEPAITPQVGYGQVFGLVYIPRFAPDWVGPIAAGTGMDVLNGVGLGHYMDTSMPGEAGNFAFAGHRQTHGQVLDNIHTLVPGDKIYVQTREGYYTYVFRNSEIVLPDRVDVLAPVPTQPDATPSERYLTMTSCNPRFGSEERIIAYSVMTEWRPLSEGPPPAIADQVARMAGRS